MPWPDDPIELGDTAVLTCNWSTLLTLGSIVRGSKELVVQDGTDYSVGDPIVVYRAGYVGGDLLAVIDAITPATSSFTLSVAAGSSIPAAAVGKLTTPGSPIATVEKPDGVDVVLTTPTVVSVGRLRTTYDPELTGVHGVIFEGSAPAKGRRRWTFNVREP